MISGTFHLANKESVLTNQAKLKDNFSSFKLVCIKDGEATFSVAVLYLGMGEYYTIRTPIDPVYIYKGKEITITPTEGILTFSKEDK